MAKAASKVQPSKKTTVQKTNKSKTAKTSSRQRQKNRRNKIIAIAAAVLCAVIIITSCAIYFSRKKTEDDKFTATPMLSAGFDHSVALRSDGTVWAWGRGQEGQIGHGVGWDGYRQNRYTPVQVIISDSGDNAGEQLKNITSIAAGKIHNLALDSNKKVWGWGWSAEGQLGKDDRRNSYVAIPIPIRDKNGTEVNIKAIDAGMLFSIALCESGNVYAWGRNSMGQLGQGSFTNDHVPRQVAHLSDIIAISAGHQHFLALKRDGTVWAAGLNDKGQLGDGTAGGGPRDDASNKNEPVQVADLSNIVAIAGGGKHSVALDKSGNVYTWGWNQQGQLGDGTTTDRHKPVKVPALDKVSRIDANGDFTGDYTLALRDGVLYSWGHNNYGQLGNRTDRLDKTTPFRVPAFDNIIHFSPGAAHVLVMTAVGDVYSWGRNWDGQLGVADAYVRNAAAKVGGNLEGKNIKKIAVGELITLALTDDGEVYGWGRNNYGQLVQGGTLDTRAPAKLGAAGFEMPPDKIIDIDISNWSSGKEGGTVVALTENGDVWAWGHNLNSELGRQTSDLLSLGDTANGHLRFSWRPIKVNGIDKVRAISVGSDRIHVLAIRCECDTFCKVEEQDCVNTTVWGWGRNSSGQLGNGMTTPSNQHVPVQVQEHESGQPLLNIVQVVAGDRNSTALDKDGNVYVWGSRANGAGIIPGGTGNVTRATLAPFTTKISKIAGNYRFLIALGTDNSVWTWGSNGSTRAIPSIPSSGDGSAASAPIRVQKTDGSDFFAEDIYIGIFTAFAKTADGRIWTWGQGGTPKGGLESGWAQEMNNGINAANMVGEVISVKSGGAHGVALLNDGTVWNWGSNNAGVLGIDETTPESIAAAVRLNPGQVRRGRVPGNTYLNLFA